MKCCCLCVALAGALAALARAGNGPADGPHPDAHDVVCLADGRPVLLRFTVHIDGKPLRAAWEDAIAHLFRHLDANGDGALDRDEAAWIPPTPLLFPSAGGEMTVPPFTVLDKNRDGKVSRAELADYYRRAGAGPLQTAPTVRFQPYGGFRARPSGDVNAALFKLLDANGDGKLSRAELAAGAARLRDLDADDDEMLSGPEVLAAASEGGRAAVQAPPFQAAPPPAAFVPLLSGASGRSLARELQQRYGGRAGKRLTRKEIGLDPATFKRLDVDEDGTLDGEELAHFAQRPADLEFSGRFARALAAGLLERWAMKGALAAKADATEDGSVVIALETARLRLRCHAAQPVRLRDVYLAQFRALDRDNNGYVDRTEAQFSRLFTGLFPLLDRDRDSKVFERELLTYLDTVGPLQARAAASYVTLTFGEQGSGLFDLLDADRDGRLSGRELRRLGQLVNQLDRDGDGQVSAAELPRTYFLSLNQGPAPFPRRMRGPAMMGEAPPRTAGPLWFRKMDRNGDGDVSRREFLGTEEEFRRIDADGDGLISAAEAERADARMRKAARP